jgi:hypothetical protein
MSGTAIASAASQAATEAEPPAQHEHRDARQRHRHGAEELNDPPRRLDVAEQPCGRSQERVDERRERRELTANERQAAIREGATQLGVHVLV